MLKNVQMKVRPTETSQNYELFEGGTRIELSYTNPHDETVMETRHVTPELIIQLLEKAAIDAYIAES